MNIVSSPAIILRQMPHGEYDRIITFISAQHGKLSGFSKSSRKLKAHSLGSLDPLVHGNMFFAFPRTTGLVHIRKCDRLAPSPLQNKTYASFLVKSLMAEVIFLSEIHPEDAYAHYKCLLSGLQSPGNIQDALVFMLNFSQLLGVDANYGRCLDCSISFGESEQKATINFANGAAYCQRCSIHHGHGGGYMRYPERVLSGFNQPNFPQECSDVILFDIVCQHVYFHLDKQPKSYLLLKQHLAE